LPRVAWQEGAGLQGAIETAIELEKKTSEFYQDLARRSDTLLSTITAAFRGIAKNRGARVAKLEALKNK
jgi:rubrerythrin